MKQISQYPPDEYGNYITDRDTVRYFWELNDRNFYEYLFKEHGIVYESSDKKSKEVTDDSAREVIDKIFELDKHWKKYGKQFNNEKDRFFLYNENLYYMSGVPGNDPTIIQLDLKDINSFLNILRYKRKLSNNIHLTLFLILFLALLGIPYFLIDLFSSIEILYIIFIFIWIGPFIYLYKSASQYKLFKLKESELKKFEHLLK